MYKIRQYLEKQPLIIAVAVSILAVLVFSLWARHVRADIQQPTDSAYDISNRNSSGQAVYIQYLGTGFSGDVAGLEVEVGLDNLSDSGTNVVSLNMIQCDSAPASISWDVTGGYPAGCGQVWDGQSFSIGATYKTLITMNTYGAVASTTLTFNPAKHYAFYLRGAQGSIPLRIYGSATQNYAYVADAHTQDGAFFSGTTLANPYFKLVGVPVNPPCGSECEPPDTTTHIVSFDPQDGATTTSPVTFNFHAYINPADLGNVIGIRLGFHNINQNTLFSDHFEGIGTLDDPYDIILVNQQATTSGDFIFSTSTVALADGNYRIEATIQRSVFGVVDSSFAHLGVIQQQSHQFIVGQETFIGHISQSSFTEANAIFGSSTATSTSALASSCNPISGFNVTNCLAFLFIPDSKQVKDTMTSFQNGVLTRFPIGYVTRFVSIVSNPATSTLPTFTVNLQLGATASTSLTFDMQDTITGAGSLLDSITDPFHGKTLREVVEPFVLLFVALLVILNIVADITGSHKGGNKHKDS